MAAASCQPAYAWADNPQGMDPCAVASNLIYACDIGSPPLAPIPPYISYPPPTEEDQTSCTCSSPFYALVSACADCQGGTYDSWFDWSHHCSHTFEIFPQNPNVMIPIWASNFNISMDPTFNFTYAQALASQPQPTSTLIASSTTSAAPSLSKTDATAIPTASGFSTTSTPFPIISSMGVHKHTKPGIIVGCVIGGLLLVLTGVFILWMRKRRGLLQPKETDISEPLQEALSQFITPFPLQDTMQAEEASGTAEPVRSDPRKLLSRKSIRVFACPRILQRHPPSSPQLIAPFQNTEQPLSTDVDNQPSEVLVVHKDSGLRLPAPTAGSSRTPVLVELPSNYSPY